jgi:hypothetical protein
VLIFLSFSRYQMSLYDGLIPRNWQSMVDYRFGYLCNLLFIDKFHFNVDCFSTDFRFGLTRSPETLHTLMVLHS